jgi:hypothetical protein
MLQQAIAVALFPDHEVQTMESLPADVPHAPDVDVIILDAASLRAKNVLDLPLPTWVQEDGIPIVWVDNADSTGAPKREKLTVVHSPIMKDRLLAAVAQSISLVHKPSEDPASNNTESGKEK